MVIADSSSPLVRCVSAAVALVGEKLIALVGLTAELTTTVVVAAADSVRPPDTSRFNCTHCPSWRAISCSVLLISSGFAMIYLLPAGAKRYLHLPILQNEPPSLDVIVIDICLPRNRTEMYSVLDVMR